MDNTSNDFQSNLKLKVCSLNARGLREKKKRQSLVTWFRNENVDILCLQETFCTLDNKDNFDKDWVNETTHIEHCLSNSAHSRGVSIIFKTSLNVTIENCKKSDDGRKLLINCIIDKHKMCIVNLYAPNDVTERINFFKKSTSWIRQNKCDENNIIVFGDFNSVMDKRDRTSGRIERCATHFENLLKSNKLIDTFRSINPNEAGFTWVDPADVTKKSRLDYILSTGFLLQFIKQCTVENAPTPDHKAVECTIMIDIKNRGPGYWKLNISHLNDEIYKNQVKSIIRSTKDEYRTCMDKRLLWDLCKIKVKEFSIKYSINKAQNRKSQMKELSQHLTEIDNEIDNKSRNVEFLTKERHEIKSKLDVLYQETAKGYQVRSRARWIEEGERNTKYFAQLERKHQTFNTITKLKSENDKTLEDNQEILAEAHKFYSNLFKSTKPDKDEINKYLRNTKIKNKLQMDEMMSCEGEITIHECESVLKHMKRNKSPGIDGLPTEFYCTFWEEIKELLVTVYNECFQKGELSYSQRTAILSLIFKKGDRLLLKNYRPISLATTDYKILAFVLASRLQKVLHKIIESSQVRLY